jgi:hypothetical protein
MTGGNYTALHPDRTPVSGKERVSLSRKTVVKAEGGQGRPSN